MDKSVPLWAVRWVSRHGVYDEAPELISTKPEIAVFRSKGEAERFKSALENSFGLLRYTGSGLKVDLEEVQYGSPEKPNEY